jgi:hypothetical protein
MELTNDVTRQRLEELLARIRKNRRGPDGEVVFEPPRAEPLAAAPAAPQPEQIEEIDDVIELTDEDEEITMEVDSEDEEVPMIPEEFDAEVPEPDPRDIEPIEIDMQPAAPMVLEPLAPTEPGEVSAEALASEPVQALELSEPGPLDDQASAPLPAVLAPAGSIAEIELDTEAVPQAEPQPLVPEAPQIEFEPPARPEPKVTVQMPVVPEPTIATDMEPTREVAVMPVEAELLRQTYQGKSPVADASPASFVNRIPSKKPDTIGQMLIAALRVGKK